MTELSRKTLIIGATGKVGRHAVDGALAAGHDVLAFGRAVERIDDAVQGLTVFRGDVRSADDVDRAVAGREVVILTFGAALTVETLRHTSDLCRTGTRLVVEAMRRHGTRRLICASALGAGDSAGHGGLAFRHVVAPALLGHLLDDRTAQEEIVRRSSLPEWVIVRPAPLTDGEAAPVRVIRNLDGEPEPGTLPRRSLAATLVRLIGDRREDGRAITLTA